MEQLPLILVIVLVILTIILSVVGVQLIMVLIELKRTLGRVNNVIDAAEHKLQSIVSPLQNLGGAVAGIRTGFKIFEEFVGWLQKSDAKK